MVAARTARQLSGFNYEKIIMAIDWTRVLIEAEGRHMNPNTHPVGHVGSSSIRQVCGLCIRTVLLQREEF